MCALCGTRCDDWLTDARGLTMDEHMGEPMYRIRSQVNEDGRPLYSEGQLITLQEAVLRDLPGARQQATVPLMERKPVHSAEDRDAPRGSDR